MGKCEHKRIKRTYPFGRKSKPERVCKDCGEIITGKMLEQKRAEKSRRKK